MQDRLRAVVGGRARIGRQRLAEAAARMAEAHPRHRVHLTRVRLASFESRLLRAATDDVKRRLARLQAIAGHLQAVGPERVLQRGYTLTLRKRDGRIIRSAAEVVPGERMITRFIDGEVEWIAEDPKQPKLFS